MILYKYSREEHRSSQASKPPSNKNGPGTAHQSKIKSRTGSKRADLATDSKAQYHHTRPPRHRHKRQSKYWGIKPRKNSEIHIDVSHSRQPLVKGERLVRYEVNTVMKARQRTSKNFHPPSAYSGHLKSEAIQQPIAREHSGRCVPLRYPSI